MEIKMSNAGLTMPVMIIVTLVLIGLGVGGYFFFLQKKELQLPEIPIPMLGSSLNDLKGTWQTEKVFVWNPETSEFHEVPADEEQKRKYTEFRDDQVCFGRLDERRRPKPCESLVPFRIEGEVIKVLNPDPSMAFDITQWSRKFGTLEFVIELPALKDHPLGKLKYILNKI